MTGQMTQPESPAMAAGNRATQLRAELERCRSQFHALLASVPAAEWRASRPFGEWTVAEQFVHLAWALEQLPKEVDAARKGKGMFNLPHWLRDWGGYWMTRWLARGATPHTVATAYNQAMDGALATLAGVGEDEWDRGANFYGEGFYTIEALYRAVGAHLVQHSVQFEPSLRAGHTATSASSTGGAEVSAKAMRWSGLALAGGTLLFAIARVGVPDEPMKALPAPATSALLFVATLLVSLALPGVYACQARAAGAVGLWGYLCLQAGLTLALIYAGAPLFFQSVGPAPREGVFAMSLGIALIVGLLLTAIATLRARVFPRWAGIAMLAATLGFIFEFLIVELLPPQVSVASGIFFGAAFALAFGWIGLAVWKNPVQSLA